ncbi:MAG: YlxR family protein [Oscillospiraceae bacterium]|nr:YlxR family protein [Oscillospiraceae bacterium]
MQKKIPMRLCIGCGQNQPKKNMIRVVKSPDQEISLDLTGKKSGRGAYLCKNPSCLTQAMKQHRLERSFSCKISQEVYERMQHVLSESESSAETP